VNGDERPDLDECLDVDLESSACTNTIPVHRMRLAIGESAQAPAVYIRAFDLAVERLEQSYQRLPANHGTESYHYRSPAFDFEARLTYNKSHIGLDYPGIASRAH
jgi:hypothetical protein